MARSFNHLIRDEARDLPAYIPGKPIDDVKRELGLTDVIKLASNESPWGPSPKAIAAMQQAVTEIHRYPDASAYDLVTALKAFYELPREKFLVGNGSDQLIQMVAQAFFRPGDEIMMGVPSFPRYATVTRLMGALPVEVPMVDGYYPLKEMVAGITSKTRALFVCNPNNPTGTIRTEEELRDFVASVPPDIILIFDEAYQEFADQPFSGVAFLTADRPVMVLRTFSKAFGLAGARIGYVIAHPDLIAGLNRVRDPFNASVPALAGALAAWQDREYLNRVVHKNREERTRLTDELVRLGVKVWPSQANFVMAFFDRDAARLGEELLHKGIIVRPGGPFGYSDGIRLTVGTREENDRLLAALAEILKK